ncbi:MAG: hypothetical protein RLY35_240 [Bacteroidota bacterium]|jgi:hypothetical protein
MESKALLKCTAFTFLLFLFSLDGSTQLVINEASNKNFSQLLDEDGEASDWVELYNNSNAPINLMGYKISDDNNFTNAFEFGSYVLEPNAYLIVFCSEKNRQYSPPFTFVNGTDGFVPHNGWNDHDFIAPYAWDGMSNLIVNTCSYSNTGYTVNSIFNQSYTSFPSAVVAFQDGGDGICGAASGELHNVRPVMKINGNVIGNYDYVNGTTDYPAPYGNWYWAARNQFMIRADELTAAGLSAGDIQQISFDVNYTDSTVYTYFQVQVKQVAQSEMTTQFINNEGAYFHTDFVLSSAGDSLYLFNPQGQVIHSFFVNCPTFDVSQGLIPNGVGNELTFSIPNPGAFNNNDVIAMGMATAPILSESSGVYSGLLNIDIYDTNPQGSTVYYTTNGNEPTTNDMAYTGTPIPIFQSTVVRARAFITGKLPSEIVSASYLINVNHSTPIVSVTTDAANLYGSNGIFDNWGEDWEKYAQMDYFDSTAQHQWVFSRQTSMQIDGGAGGSRSNPQHSFRLEFAKSDFNETPVLLPLIPHQPNRAKYDRLYFRNGSNQWLQLPYKDAALTEMTTRANHGYYSTMRPVSVYLNGQYFGLYEMREKLDEEYFKQQDNGSKSSMDVLSLSYWNGGVLRATSGDVNHYWNDVGYVWGLDPAAPDYMTKMDSLFDMTYLTDYIIGETFVTNYDWPYNNIKIHRSDSTMYKWRFATIDLELSLQPNGWSDCNSNGLEHAMNTGQDNPYIRPWWQSMSNPQYRRYFINRYADVLNSTYKEERLLDVENNFFNIWTPEMPNEYQRWGDPWNVSGWMNDYYNRHLQLRDELTCKTTNIRGQIQTILGLGTPRELTLNIEPSDAGVIQLNTLNITDSTWAGTYFEDVDIDMMAYAKPGYVFSHWGNNSVITDTLMGSWNGFINQDSLIFTANFAVDTTLTNLAENSSFFTQVYPNPAQNQIRITTDPEKKLIRIFDIMGKEVITQYLPNGSTELDISAWSSGCYMIKVLNPNNGSSQSMRFIKR